jgi:esterase/lipase superfamily enzyme
MRSGESLARGQQVFDSTEVVVFYATDRKRTSSCEPEEIYGSELGQLVLGRLLVSVPEDHRLGRVERPSFWRFEFEEDPAKHVVLLSVDPMTDDSFFSALDEHMASDERRQAFVFVHGFNVTFAEAARRTAQIAYDLKFEGAPIMYSWPSAGSLTAYLRDREIAAVSAQQLATLLAELPIRTGAETVHVIAHSMGNRVLTAALGNLAESRPAGSPPLFEELVLAAPDVDSRTFQRELAEVVIGSAERVTIYTSARDRALIIARDVADFPRLGDASAGVLIHQPIETIDATWVDTSFVGHSYYGDNRSVMSDLFLLLRDRRPAADRFGLEPVQTEDGVYWRFRR